MSLLLKLDFTRCFGIPIVDFEQVNASRNIHWDSTWVWRFAHLLFLFISYCFRFCFCLFNGFFSFLFLCFLDSLILNASDRHSEIGLVGMIRSSRQEVFCEKGVLRNFTKLTGKHCNFIKKETLAQVFSCKFCVISKKTFSYRTPLVAASVWLTINDQKQPFTSVLQEDFPENVQKFTKKQLRWNLFFL